MLLLNQNKKVQHTTTNYGMTEGSQMLNCAW